MLAGLSFLARHKGGAVLPFAAMLVKETLFQVAHIPFAVAVQRQIAVLRQLLRHLLNAQPVLAPQHRIARRHRCDLILAVKTPFTNQLILV